MMKRILFLIPLLLFTIGIMAQSAATNVHNGHEYVDLGLPSGTLWATCNVGATTPEGYGDYFAWGETSTKEKYSRKTYSGLPNLTTLDASHDAATVNWGDGWRTPTAKEYNELHTECTCKWTTFQGRQGYHITGKNGNSIFLPAAGWYRGSKLKQYAFPYAGYLTASASPGSFAGFYVVIIYENYYTNYWDMHDKYWGFSVRAVCSGKQDKLLEEPSAPVVEEPQKPIVAETFQVDEDEHEYVDLGLPSGTLWATYNVGATIPEGYGDYFAWGETNIKGHYDWSTYKHGTAYNALSKYCDLSTYGASGYTDSKNILDAIDDAAVVHWGNAWRTPTAAELQELREHCTWEWTTKNEVNGYKVTGKNGNSIFLPAAGYRYDSELNGVGKYGYYLSASSNASYPNHAQYTYFRAEKQEENHISRYYGQTIRPVRSAKQEEPKTSNDAEAQEEQSKTNLRNYLWAGTDFTNQAAGYSLDWQIGARIRQRVFLGAELGWHHLINAIPYSYKNNEFTTDYWYIPFGGNIKVYFPINNAFRNSWHITLSGGGYMGYGYYMSAENLADDIYVPLNGGTLSQSALESDWQRYSVGGYVSTGLGMSFSRFTFGAGYTMLLGDINGHLGYVKVGLILGNIK